MKLRTLVLAMALTGAFARMLPADVVVLTNGDRLHGEIVTLADSKLLLKTTYAGEIVIDWSEVAAASTDKPIAIETRGGQRFTAALSAAEKGIALSPGPGVDGELVVAVSEITFMGKAAGDAAVAERLMAKAYPERMAMAGEWSGTLDLAYTGHAGNSEDTALQLRAKLKKESKRDRFTVEGAYDYGEDAGARSVTKGVLNIRYDYRHRPRFFSWYELKDEHDRFADIDMRTTAGTGVGFKAVDRENFTLELRAGATYVDTNNIDPVPDASTAGTLTGLELSWNIMEGLKFTQVLNWEYGFDESDHRIHLEATLRREFSKTLSLRISVIDDYDSDPAPARKKNDVTIFAGLGIAF